MSELDVPVQLTLDDLAAEIEREVIAGRADLESAVRRAIHIGDLLIDAKARVPHGEWYPWIKANCSFGKSQAQNYMKLARNAQRVGHLPSPRKALELLAGESADETVDENRANEDSEPDEPVWTDEQLHLRELLEQDITVVVNLRAHDALIEWARERGLFVRVDRTSPWGNPFVLGDDGDRDAVIDAYRTHYLPHKPSLMARIEELYGKALGCWCAPDRCHADVLADYCEE